MNRRQSMAVVAAALVGAAVGVGLLREGPAFAQSSGFELRYSSAGSWQAQAGFSQVASVRQPGRLLFVAGVGGKDEKEKSLLKLGDFAAQCQAAWSTIGKILEREGGSVKNIVRVVTYVTDTRNLQANNACRNAVFGEGPYPPHTFLNVSQLAIPGMLVEVEVTAALPN